MGGSASYRLAKKIANARDRGAPQSEIDELERRRQEALVSEKQKRQETKQTPEKTFRNKVNGAKTNDELLSILQEKYGSENIQKGFVTMHNLEMTKRTLNTVMELEDRYPFMKGAISGFHVVVDPFGGVAAEVKSSFSPSTGESKHTLGIGAAFATNDNPELYSGNERGHHPPNMTPEAVVAHEFGHALHNYLLGRMLQDARKKGFFEAVMMVDDIKKDRTLQQLEKQAKQSIGYKKALPYLRGEISEYASGAKMYGGKPTEESFAEAFADVYSNGDNASSVSKAYVNTLLNEINRLGYGG